MNIPLDKHRKEESTGGKFTRLQNRPSEIGWNHSSVTALIHKLCLSQSRACSLAIHLLVSHWIYLATSNMWLAQAKDKHNTLNMHWRHKIYHSKGCSERRSVWSSRHSCHGKVRWEGGQTGNIPMSVWSPGAVGVIGVARLGWLSVHSNAVQCQGWGDLGGVAETVTIAAVLRRSLLQKSTTPPQESTKTDRYSRELL